MPRGIDCASRLTAATAARAKAAGFDFVGRYLVPESYGKALTKAEAEIITAAGLRLLTVYESTADRARQGWEAGAADGLTARKCAEAIGMPTAGIIYFAVDFNAQPADMTAIAQYLSGAFSACGDYRIGVYGSYYVVEEMAKRLGLGMHSSNPGESGICSGFWQCVAWSGGQISPHTTVYQSDWSGTAAAKAAAAKIGVSVDLNTGADMDRAGIWSYSCTDNEEDNMSGEEIYKRVQDYLATQPAPDWAADELREATDAGITDGERPMQLVPRYQAAIMALRAVKRARKLAELAEGSDGK